MRHGSRGWRSARWGGLTGWVGARTGQLAAARSRGAVRAPSFAHRADTPSPPLSFGEIFPSPGVFFLLLFCFVILSTRLPLGEVAAIGALLSMASSKGGIHLPKCYIAYLGYVAMATIGYFSSPYKPMVFMELRELYKVALIGLTACTILGDRRSIRGFVFGYLALYAVFPIRGSLYNYIMGISEGGRFAWNFIFENPNDLAILTLLPVGMCGYFLMSEKTGVWRHAALIGLVVTTLVLLLTQSRGALLGVMAGGLYFFARSQRRGQAMLFATIGLVIAAALAPGSVWTRLGGLANISVTGGMAGVDKESSAESRWQIMGVGIKIAKANPLLGVGVGAYPTEHYLRTLNGEVIKTAAGLRDAHSSYVRSAAETGFIGFACIVAFIFLAWREVVRTRLALPARYANQAHALMAFEVSLVAFAVAVLFGSAERLTFFLLQVLVPYAAARVMRAELIEGRTPAAS